MSQQMSSNLTIRDSVLDTINTPEEVIAAGIVALEKCNLNESAGNLEEEIINRDVDIEDLFTDAEEENPGLLSSLFSWVDSWSWHLQRMGGPKYGPELDIKQRDMDNFIGPENRFINLNLKRIIEKLRAEGKEISPEFSKAW